MDVQKRGQVTLFVILGVLLLLAVLLFAVFREKVTIFSPDKVVPTETSAIQHYIDSCIEGVGREGLTLLGAQGGYIWLPPLIENNPLAYLDSGVKLPFWQYQDENRIPSLELMRAQLGRYVGEQLRGCLQGLDVFTSQYDLVEKEAPSVDVSISDQVVGFSVRYPLDIMNKQGTKITEMLEFHVDVPVKLKQAYEVASAIMGAEAREMRLEKIAVDLLSIDPSIPVVGTELTCTKKMWSKPDVEKKIKILLQTNLPQLRADFTDYTPVADDAPYVASHYIWRVTDVPYKGIRTAFALGNQQPFQMAVRPNSGPLLKSSELRGQEMISFLCLQQWNFVYDLRFPVVVTVEDSQADYALQFAILVSVRNNRGDREQLGQPQPFFEQTEGSDESYCDNVYGNYLLNVRTFDNVSDPTLGETHEPIDRVNVSFTCLKYSCDMGQTRYEQRGAVAQLTRAFPYCVNGVLRGVKSGYASAQQFVTTTAGKDVGLYLTPLKVFDKYTVVKHLRMGNLTTAARPLDSGEKAFISLSYTSNGTVLHRAWGGYPTESSLTVQPLELLADARFPYHLEVFLVDEENGLRGGYQGVWTPDWASLKNAKSVEFHVIGKDSFANDAEMLAFLSSLGQLSTTVPQPVVR